MLGPEIVERTIDQIKFIWDKLLTAQSQQKNYVDQRRRPLEYQEGEYVFLRVSPTIGVGRALKTRKLSPYFLGPYQFLNRVDLVAYHLALP